MTLAEAKQYFTNSLKPIYSAGEIKSLFFYWADAHLGLTQTNLILQKDNPLDNLSEKHLAKTISRLKKKEPIQYILGETIFLDLPFRVKPGVLIPRPETEELVRHIIKENSHLRNLRILDVGTGSGCIAVSLAKNLDASILAIDKSRQALAIASENATLNNVEVSFLQLDIKTLSYKLSIFDIIVSNPPYVLSSEKAKMDINILDYEPNEALFVPDDDPLLFYRKIVSLAKKSLSPKGKIYFEINETQGKAITNLLAKNNFTTISLFQDIHGKDRFVKGNYGQ